MCRTAMGVREFVGAQRSLVERHLESIAGLLVMAHTAGKGWKQGYFQIGLLRRCDGEPAEATGHLRVGADFKPQRTHIKFIGFVLIEYKKSDVRELCDHKK